MVYGQKSEKSEIILEGGEQMSIFNEADSSLSRILSAGPSIQ